MTPEVLTQAKQMARDGYGWEDIQVKFGLSQMQAKLIVSVAAKPKKVAR